MEISHWQKLSGLLLKPPSFRQGLALGTMAVTAGVIGRALKTTTVTLVHMPSQLRSATDLNGSHDFNLRAGQPMGSAVAQSVLTKNIGQFGTPSFSCFLPLSLEQHRESAFS